MPLISCPECQAQISDQAIVCIRCGYPLIKTPEKNLPPPRKRLLEENPHYDDESSAERGGFLDGNRNYSDLTRTEEYRSPQSYVAEKKSNSVQAVISVIVAVGLLWYFFGGGLNSGVAKNFEKQYVMSVRSGTPIDVCVHAGLVAAAYLQAHDQLNYQRWKQTESADCALAGMPK